MTPQRANSSARSSTPQASQSPSAAYGPSARATAPPPAATIPPQPRPLSFTSPQAPITAQVASSVTSNPSPPNSHKAMTSNQQQVVCSTVSSGARNLNDPRPRPQTSNHWMR